MTRALRALAALTLLAAPLAAQGPIADRLLALAGKSAPPDTSACKLSGGDFRIASTATYLQTALTTPVADNKRRALIAGRDQALIGIQGGQAGSNKAWYFYGRTLLQLGDLAGADSAFAKTAQLAPTCKSEVGKYRTGAWSILMNAAVVQRNAQHADSSLFFARAANQIEPGRPQGWYTIGAAFLDAQQNDSAAWYMQKAYQAPVDSSAVTQGVRQAAAFQYGVIAFNARDYTGAAQAFGLAVQLKADDADAKRNLAAALRRAGMADSAQKIEQSMMAAGAGTDAGLTTDQLMNIGVEQFNAQKFADAAATFEKILSVEPNNRDALFNAANAYLGQQDGEKLLATALKLQAIDPMSEDAMKLVANGYRLKHDQANLMKTATALGGATVTLSVAQNAFAPSATGATLAFTATGRDGRDVNDRPVRGVAVPIVVEFLNKDGAVVSSADAVVPVVAAGATAQIPVTGTGAGIIAWRYHRK